LWEERSSTWLWHHHDEHHHHDHQRGAQVVGQALDAEQVLLPVSGFRSLGIILHPIKLGWPPTRRQGKMHFWGVLKNKFTFCWVNFWLLARRDDGA
jgi:hypothetical protein